MNSRIILNKIYDMVCYIKDKGVMSNSNLFICAFAIHHLIVLFPLTVAVYYNTSMIMSMVVIIEIIFIAQYIFFKGCIITRIEQKIEKNNINVVDGLLEFLGLQIKYKNRIFVTLLYLCFSIMLVVYKLLYSNNMLHF